MNSEVDDGEMNQQKQQTGRGGESRDTEISKKKKEMIMIMNNNNDPKQEPK